MQKYDVREIGSPSTPSYVIMVIKSELNFSEIPTVRYLLVTFLEGDPNNCSCATNFSPLSHHFATFLIQKDSWKSISPLLGSGVLQRPIFVALVDSDPGLDTPTLHKVALSLLHPIPGDCSHNFQIIEVRNTIASPKASTD